MGGIGRIFGFEGPSEEELDRARMEAQANVHTFYEMLDSLDREQLVSLGHVLAVGIESPQRISQFYGEVITLLRLKHQSCACGRDHTDPSSLLGEAPEVTIVKLDEDDENRTPNEDNQP
jgi:hypothetical protein